MSFLGIDTSNYTTSAALCGCDGIRQSKKLLPVKPGELGLRQSDAVFSHVRQLPDVLSVLLKESPSIEAIGVSDRPRAAEGSYMPCFSVGAGAARVLGDALHVPVYFFSHQAGHIAAAAYSAGHADLLNREFIAFHVSGGTTEAVIVRPDAENIISAELAASSLDLKAGQAIDRCGVMLGLPFPAGPRLEELAISCDEKIKARAIMRGADCSLSGIENKCRKLLDEGASDAYIARTCIESVLAALDGMCNILLQEHPGLPVVFAGGVSSNSIIRASLSEKYGAFFADPVFSADNAAGTAYLASLRRQ